MHKFTKILILSLLLITFAINETYAQEQPEEDDILITTNPQSTLNFQDILLSEILPNPQGTDTNNEWIEIYNQSNKAIDLSQITIQRFETDEINNTINIIDEHLFNNNDFIQPNEYFVFYPEFSIVNKKCEIRIIDNADNIIDEISYSYETSIPEEISISKIENEIYQTSPTPASPNIFINLEFELKNENGENCDSFIKGESVYIIDNSIILGTTEISEYRIDDTIFDDDEIETANLDLGEHSFKVIFNNNSTELKFTINENFEKIEISEVFPNPEGKDETGINEWIELYNAGTNDINLKGLIIERTTDSQVYQFVIEQDLEINSKEFVLIYPTFTLNNSSNNLKLIAPSEELINTFSYDINTKDNESIIWINDEIKLTTTPTPNKSNIWTTKECENDDIIQENDTTEINDNKIKNKDFSDLEISEIFPNPEGKDLKGENEWIEIYNSGKKEINLKGLVLVQETSKEYIFEISEDLQIKSHNYILIYPSFSINNSGARLFIKNIEDEIFDEVFYDANVKEENSLIRQDNSQEFVLTKNPTPNASNVQTGSVLSVEDIIEESINSAKEKSVENITQIKGSITVEPGILGDEICYIQDESGGIQIEIENIKDFKDLTKNTIIEVIGEIDEYHNEKKIVTTSENITLTNEENIIQPELVKIGEVDVGEIGNLITIKGYVVKTSGNTFYINDSTGIIKVQIKDSTNIVRPECRKNYYAEITGILSVWDTDENGNPNYRLLPRYQEDVFISKTLAKTGGINILGLSLGIIILIISKRYLK